MRRRSRRRLIAALTALLALGAPAGATGEAQFVGSYTWRMDDPGFGGFSGIELSDDGTRFTAISDRARIVSGTITREGGRITEISAGPIQPLRGPDGRPMAPNIADSEGLAIRPDGRMFVSFEGVNRVWSYDTPAAAGRLPRARAFRSLQSNSGLEALAIDDRGRLYTLPERSGELTRPFPVWRYENGAWSEIFAIPRRGGYLPVGADFGPDGRLYILERVFTGFAFRSRIRRFTITETAVTREETLLESLPFRFDNLEGIAVWRDAEGGLRLTMISDDNFNALQRTQLVEYRVPESLAPESGTP